MYKACDAVVGPREGGNVDMIGNLR